MRVKALSFYEFEHFDEADKLGDRERTPLAAVEVVVGNGLVVGSFVHPSLERFFLGQFVERDERRAECAACLTDVAVLLEIGEAHDAAREGSTEADEIPGMADEVGPFDGRIDAIPIEVVRHEHDAF